MFNDEIIAAGLLTALDIFRIPSSLSSKQFIANALITKVIFQLHSIVAINLRLKRLARLDKTYHVEEKHSMEVYNLI